MLWAIILIACLLAFAKVPSFRKTVFVIAGCLALLIVGYLGYDKIQTALSKGRVRPEQLEFTELRLGSESFGRNLTGRVKNNSRHEVFAADADIRLLDCDEAHKCEVIGEETTDILTGSVPAGQVRDINASIHFSGSTQPRGKFEWNYTIKEVRARN